MIVGAVLLVPLIAIMKQRLDELAEIIFGGGPKRLLAPGHIVPDRRPFVSIHIPAYREPPEMLRQTLDSVAKLDWPNFECIVVINNTPEASYWRPIEEHCELLGRASSSCARISSRVSRPARSDSRSSIPRRKQRSSACSTPTMWSIPIG